MYRKIEETKIIHFCGEERLEEDMEQETISQEDRVTLKIGRVHFNNIVLTEEKDGETVNQRL